jgi:hypothetical protein
MSDVNGNLVPDSVARYTPFGDWRTEPGTNPEITDRGYTGHAHNNSGANDLGLIYMNARYYVPYFDLQEDLDWAEARMDIVNSLGPTPEITKMAQDAVDSFFENTDETIGQTGFILSATLNDQLGMDPDWNLVLSEEFKDVTQNTLGSFSETVGKLGTKGLFVYAPTAYALTIREGARATVTASLVVNVEIFEASLPQLSGWASDE